MVNQYFQEKYFTDKSKTLLEQFRPFSSIKNQDKSDANKSNVFFGVLGDFKYLLFGTFVLFNLANFGNILYTYNKDKTRIEDMGRVVEGKGIIAKLTPLNPS